MDETAKSLNDFLIWVYEQKKFALCKEIEGEEGREWVPMLLSHQGLVEQYQKFVQEQGLAVEVFASLGYHA